MSCQSQSITSSVCGNKPTPSPSTPAASGAQPARPGECNRDRRGWPHLRSPFAHLLTKRVADEAEGAQESTRIQGPIAVEELLPLPHRPHTAHEKGAIHRVGLQQAMVHTQVGVVEGVPKGHHKGPAPLAQKASGENGAKGSLEALEAPGHPELGMALEKGSCVSTIS